MPIVEHRWRRNTKTQWESLNPILGPGEPGYEIGNGDRTRFKVGDGHSRWNDLQYFSTDGATPGQEGSSDLAVLAHINDETPHPVYDDGPSLMLLYQNAKV